MYWNSEITAELHRQELLREASQARRIRAARPRGHRRFGLRLGRRAAR